INPNSKAFYEGLQVDDTLLTINGQQTRGLNHNEVQALIKNATTGTLSLLIQRDKNAVNNHVNGDYHRSPVGPASGSDVQDSFSTLPPSKPGQPYTFPDKPHEHRQNGPSSNEFHGIGHPTQRS
ncbi:unnamed protein product, partial [Candidula unifasciata]